MNEEKINKIYDKYDSLIMHNFLKYTIIIGAVGLSLVLFNAKDIFILKNMGSLFTSTGVLLLSVIIPPFLCAQDFNKNIRDFKNKYNNFKFSRNPFSTDKGRQKALKKNKIRTKNEYIKKCETVKKEVTNPVHADLYNNELPEKVKVKVKTR